MSKFAGQTIILPDMPYKSQRDNLINPGGACNVTSIAMLGWRRGIRGDGSQGGQLEDQMYVRCTRNGWSRHDPYGLKKLAESYGLVDRFIQDATLDDIRQAIADGYGCALHGYFTLYGHILVVKGFDDYGFFVNDPWGEYFRGGYDTSVSGENLHYSNNLIANKCSPESVLEPRHIWLHRI
jgi:hypothetical protein